MAAKEKPPAFQFYPQDYLASARVAEMTLEEEGVYIRLLCYCWTVGSIPADPERCARLAGKGCSVATATAVQRSFNVCSTDPSRLTHDRLEKERLKQEEFRRNASLAGQKSAKMRAEGKKRQKHGSSSQRPFNARSTPVENPLNGGSTNLPTDCQPEVNSSSSSSSSSSVIKPPPTPPTALVVDTDVGGGGDKESSGRTAAAHILQSFTQATGIKAMVTQKRIAAVRERIRDPVWRENWMKALEIASQMPALFGDNDRNWVMNVEWFLRPDTVAKILEGFYDNWSRTRTKAERHEQVTANAFQRIRDAIAADAAAGCEEGWSIPDGTGTTLFLKEHAATDGSSG